MTLTLIQQAGKSRLGGSGIIKLTQLVMILGLKFIAGSECLASASPTAHKASCIIQSRYFGHQAKNVEQLVVMFPHTGYQT